MRYTIAILAILSFASCKKEYTCNCVDKDGNNVYSNDMKLARKEVSDMKSQCVGKEALFTLDYPNKTPITCTFN